jgi:Mlc titration factor MtfA (ptsG expression regulator)
LGIGTKVTDEDRMLVASSAVIPIFGFQDWHYFNLSEVHVHPTKFKIPGQDKYARGLIGWGGMDGIMKLSRKALHEGFQDQNDQRNVAIHEFIHIIDKQDGEVDGVLENLIKEIDIMPWLHLMHQEMSEIKAGQSTIREYGAANRAEFLAVAGEYFFESPEKMKAEHPALYTALDSMFNPKVTPKADKFKYTKKYDPCPCGSGRKFSKCCLKNAANY